MKEKYHYQKCLQIHVQNKGRFQNQGKLVEVACDFCTTTVKRYVSDVKRTKHNFCCKECSGEFKSSFYIGKNHWRHLRVTSICGHCGKQFEHIPSKQRMFCSHSCKNKKQVYHSGIKNPNWKGGITPKLKAIRTSKDYLLWRKIVFERDNYTCQECGLQNNLQAHHLEHLSKNLSRAFDITNGLTLCIDCHQKQHPELKLTLRGGKK